MKEIEAPGPVEIHEMLVRAHNVLHLMMDEDIVNVREAIDDAVKAHGSVWIWYGLVHWADTFIKAMRAKGWTLDGDNLRFVAGNGAVPADAVDPAKLLTADQVEPAAVQAAEWILARVEDDEDKGRAMFRALVNSGDETCMAWLNKTLMMCAANTRSLGGCPL